MGDILSFPSCQTRDRPLRHRRGPPHTSRSSRTRSRAVCARPTICHNRREAALGGLTTPQHDQVGGYKPSTVIDFEIPKKYAWRQTIARHPRVGGIMRACAPYRAFRMSRDMERLCPELAPQLRQPDGTTAALVALALLRPSPLPQCPAHCCELAKDIACRITKSTIVLQASTTWRFYLTFERGQDLYPEIVRSWRRPYTENNRSV
jgi:hypothetical protein